MKIVIDISAEDFEKVKCGRGAVSMMRKAIIHGTPLPKGYGDLIQREDAEAIFRNARKALYEQSKEERIKDLETREMMLLNAEQFVHMIEPVIKAESEETE